MDEARVWQIADTVDFEGRESVAHDVIIAILRLHWEPGDYL